MPLVIERRAIQSEREALERLATMGYRSFVTDFPAVALESPHWHKIEVVIAAIEGQFQLFDGDLEELVTVDACDWTVTPAGVPHAFTAEKPGRVVVGYSADIGFSEIEAFDPAVKPEGNELDSEGVSCR